MNKGTIFFCLIAILSSQSWANDRHYTINLDLPPKERFSQVNKDFKDKLLGVIKEMTEGLIAKLVLYVLDMLKFPLGRMLHHWDGELREEVEALAEELGGEYIHLQLLYLGQLSSDLWSPIRNFFGHEKPYVPGCYNETNKFVLGPLGTCTSIVANQ